MSSERLEGNITRALVDRIGGAIVRGENAPGEQLPTEAEMSAQFGASRTATREAIKMLTAKGLVRSWPRRGTLVQSESEWNLLDPDVLVWLLDRRFSGALLKDFLQMRLAIEPAAARMAAERGSDTVEIADALQAMRNAANGVGDSLEADSAFHAAILRASGNRFFAQMAPLVATALRLTVRRTNQLKGVRVANVDDHEDILTAISAGNAEEAQTAAESLILEALALIDSGVDAPN